MAKETAPEDLAKFRAVKVRAEQIRREKAGSEARKGKKGGELKCLTSYDTGLARNQ